MLEEGVSVCMLIGKLHVLVRNSSVVNFAVLFTQVTNSCTMVVVHKLWGWHVEQVRLLLALHILCLNHLHISGWIECW
jgi:hypothetical protein